MIYRLQRRDHAFRAWESKINNGFPSFLPSLCQPRPSLSVFPFSCDGFKLTIPIRWETSVNTLVRSQCSHDICDRQSLTNSRPREDKRVIRPIIVSTHPRGLRDASIFSHPFSFSPGRYRSTMLILDERDTCRPRSLAIVTYP